MKIEININEIPSITMGEKLRSVRYITTAKEVLNEEFIHNALK